MAPRSQHSVAGPALARVRRLACVGIALTVLVVDTAGAQVIRSMAQDATVNNLRLPPAVRTTTNGTLGRVRRVGNGTRPMVLIPGLGFGDAVWDDFMARHAADYTMYAVSLPGFGGTPPLATPPEDASYTDTPWFSSAVTAVQALVEADRLTDVVLVAHWALGSQVALKVALNIPNRIRAVVLVSGVLRSYFDTPPSVPSMKTWTLTDRVRYSDRLAHDWFKTVTRHTWDDNNFMSFDYAVNPLRGLFLWREAQAPLLPVWVRYLLEFYSLDLSIELRALKVPTLVVQPGFDDDQFYVDAGRNYMRNLCLDSWDTGTPLPAPLTVVRIPQSRLFVMFDQPDQLDQAIDRFLRALK